MATKPQRWPYKAEGVRMDSVARFADIEALAANVQMAAWNGNTDLVIAMASRIARIATTGKCALRDAALGRYP